MLKFMRISKRMILGVVCSIAGSTLSFFVPLLIKDFIDNKKFDLSLLYVFPFLFAAHSYCVQLVDCQFQLRPIFMWRNCVFRLWI